MKNLPQSLERKLRTVMLRSIQKFGIVMLVSSGVGYLSLLANSQQSLAQAPDSAQNRPPVCEGSPPNGRVKCNYENGDNYQGNFVNGRPQGQGIYVYSNGDRYEGQFGNGVPNGQGVFLFANDDRIVGEFRNGLIVRGEAIFANGDRYRGTFEIVQQTGGGLLAVSRTAKGNLSLLVAIATPDSFSQETRLVRECSPALTARAAPVSFSTNS
jgi:hypothetical protein